MGPTFHDLINGVFNIHDKPATVFEQNTGNDRYFYLRVGEIIDVDLDKYYINVQWKTGSGSHWMPMNFALAGPGTMMGGAPEMHSLVLCGYIDEGGGKGTPFGITYLPRGLQAGLDHAYAKLLPDSIPSENNLVFFKFRKLLDGDLTVASHLGGELFVNRDIELKDSAGDQILIRSSDQSIISTSVNNFTFNNGVAINSGSIIRNRIPVFDNLGNRIIGQPARELNLLGGRTHVYLTPFGNTLEEGARYYTEYKIDVDDIAPGFLDKNDINSSTFLSNKDPIVSFALGNYVPSVDKNKRYGKIIRPSMFKDSKDLKGKFQLLECTQNRGVDEIATLGMAFAIHLLENDAFIGFDKEGQFFLNMGASSKANPSGAGRSMSMKAPGSLKESWGMDTETGNSWGLYTQGGVKWNIGKHNNRGFGRSIDIRTSSGVKFDYTGADDDGFAKIEYVNGDQEVVIRGNETTTVTKSSELIVNGSRTETIRGAASYHYIVDKTESCLGVLTQNAGVEMQGKYGKVNENILTGKKLTLALGNNEDTILGFGFKKTFVTSGGITETVILGSKKVSVITGNYEVKVKVGGIKMKSSLPVNITGTAGVKVSSINSISLASKRVKIGIPAQNGVLTGVSGTGVPTAQCFITGLPYKGSRTVSASL